MSTDTISDRIVETLQTAEKPALSARQIADRVDVSVRTVNTHLDTLVADGQVETMQIGNATAYYVGFKPRQGFREPSYQCVRCGRPVVEAYDFAKVETTAFFKRQWLYGSRRGQLYIPTNFYVFCRFCYTDLFSWMWLPAAVGEYPFVDKWSLPRRQAEDAAEKPLASVSDTEIAELPGVLAPVLKRVRRSLGDHTLASLVDETAGDDVSAAEAQRALWVLVHAGFISPNAIRPE